MKKFFTLIMLTTLNLQASELNYKDYYKESQGCFILFDVNNNKTIEQYNVQYCKKTLPPNSTFKIPLSIMGFDKKILKDENNPKWEFKEEYLAEGFKNWMPIEWKGANTPKSWLKYSVLWYSQKLAPMIGTEEITKYLFKFNYGNKDFSGTPKIKNEESIPWVDSSLKISAENQIQFLKSFVTEKLPVSIYSMQETKKLLLIDQSNSKVSLYGKTGAGYLKN